jgi:hypothetical protein
MIFWAFVGACRGKRWFDRNRSLKKMRWMEDRRGERRPSYLIQEVRATTYFFFAVYVLVDFLPVFFFVALVVPADSIALEALVVPADFFPPFFVAMSLSFRTEMEEL